MGSSAQPRPRKRSSQAGRATGRGAATTAACNASRPASEGMNGRATPRRVRGPVKTLLTEPGAGLRRGLQPALELVQLLAQLVGQPLSEAPVVLADLGQLLKPALGVDLEQLLDRLARDVEAFGLDPAFTYGRHEPDRRLDRLGLAVAPAEDPGQ